MQATQLTINKNNRAAYRIETHMGEFTLVRSTARPNVLYPVNSRLEHCTVSGYRHFVERGGKLVGVK